jgi:hypothetical protein
MKNNKHMNSIKLHFSKYKWFNNIYSTTYKNEYVIIVNDYPYTEDHLFFEYEKLNNVRIRIHVLGGK